MMFLRSIRFLVLVLSWSGCSRSSAIDDDVPADSDDGGQSRLEDDDESDFQPPSGAFEGPAERGPWNNRLRLATSPDGISWTRADHTIIDASDVPAAIVVDGRLWVFFVLWRDADDTIQNTTVAAYTDDLEDWTFKELTFEGLPSGWTQWPVDPAIVHAGGGVYRLYFTLGTSGETHTATTHSATSTDLLHWTYEDARIHTDENQAVLDPNLLWVGDHYEFFAGGGQGNHHFVSEDGLSFEKQDPFAPTIEGSALMMANGCEFDDSMRYYGFTQSPGGASEIFSLSYDSDAGEWTIDDGVRLAASPSDSDESDSVKDPAVSVHPRGAEYGYVMIYVTGIP